MTVMGPTTPAVKVMGNKYLLQAISSYTSGVKGKDWRDGDLAAKLGYLELIRDFFPNLTFTEYAIDVAARNGHLEVVKFLHGKGLPCTEWAVANAAEHGHLEVVKFLILNRSEGCTEQALDNAAMNGHFPVFKWLVENANEGISKDLIIQVVRNGHLEVLKILVANFEIDKNDSRIFNDAVYSLENNLEMVKWLHQQGFKKPQFLTFICDQKISEYLTKVLFVNIADPLLGDHSGMAVNIIENGNLTFFKYLDKHVKFSFQTMKYFLTKALLSEKCQKEFIEYLLARLEELGAVSKELLTEFANDALINKRLDIFELLIDRGALLKKINMTAAILSNSLELVEKIFAISGKLPNNIYKAIEANNLSMVKWLIEKGVKIDQDAMEIALEYGYIKIIEFLLDLGLEINGKNINNAIGSKNPRLFSWLAQKGLAKDSRRAFGMALENFHYDAIKFHVTRDYKLTKKDFGKFAEEGDLRLVKLCHEYKVDYVPKIMDLAIGEGHLAVTIFLHENYPEGCTKISLVWAISRNHLAMVKWLTKNRPHDPCATRLIAAALSSNRQAMTRWLYLNHTESDQDLRNNFLPQIPSSKAVDLAHSPSLKKWMVDLINRFKLCYKQVTGTEFVEELDVDSLPEDEFEELLAKFRDESGESVSGESGDDLGDDSGDDSRESGDDSGDESG